MEAVRPGFREIRDLSERMTGGILPSIYFEFLFYMGMKLFDQMAGTVLETGLGGRLDTTNVIRHPLVSVDHFHKSGSYAIFGRYRGKNRLSEGRIIKPGVPVIYDDPRRPL